MKSVQAQAATTPAHNALLPMMMPVSIEEEQVMGYEAAHMDGFMLDDELRRMIAEFDEECLRERESADKCNCSNCDDSWMLIF